MIIKFALCLVFSLALRMQVLSCENQNFIDVSHTISLDVYEGYAEIAPKKVQL